MGAGDGSLNINLTDSRKPKKDEVPVTISISREMRVHVDVKVNPFLTEEQREKILRGEEQDPEID